MYAYVAGNPVNYIDKYGDSLASFSLCMIGLDLKDIAGKNHQLKPWHPLGVLGISPILVSHKYRKTKYAQKIAPKFLPPLKFVMKRFGKTVGLRGATKFVTIAVPGIGWVVGGAILALDFLRCKGHLSE